jgi:hypothetical protein
MSGALLTVASTLQCPHGAAVTIVPANPVVQVAGAPLAMSTDTFIVVGCPFLLPTVPPIPSPCITVQWVVTNLVVSAGGSAALDQTSQGICYSALGAPQGLVVVVNTQPLVVTP